MGTIRLKLIFTLFIIYNTCFAQAKQEITLNYDNVLISQGDKSETSKKKCSITYNYGGIKEDVLVKLGDNFYHFIKVKPNKRGKRSSDGKEYTYSTYMSNSKKYIYIISYDDISEGVALVLNDNFSILIF